MPVVVVGLNHRTCPVEVRERLAFAPGEIPGALETLRREGVAEEAVILSTCNRVEIYAAGAAHSRELLDAARDCFVQRHPDERVGDALYGREEPESLRHLFRVAAGLDSMMLGETEILGQLKQAYQLALKHRLTGRRLNKAFQKAFHAAKQIRTETGIQRGSVSVASAAVELAEKIFSSLARKTVLVIGAGDTSEKTARALTSRGAERVLVTNRSPERAAELASELGGRSVPFDDWESEFVAVDIAISSTSAPGYVLSLARLEALCKARRHRPLLLIDIAVPRDIDPAVNHLDDVYLYNIDDLEGIAENARQQRSEEIARCEAIIAERVKGLLTSSRVDPTQRLRPACGS